MFLESKVTALKDLAKSSEIALNLQRRRRLLRLRRTLRCSTIGNNLSKANVAGTRRLAFAREQWEIKVRTVDTNLNTTAALGGANVLTIITR